MSRGTTIVSGATGFAGAHLMDRLVGTTSREVVAWARPGGQPPVPRDGVRWQHVDIVDAASVAGAVAAAQPAEIFHLAGAAHVGDSWQRPTWHLDVHARGTHHLLEAVRTHAPACRVLIVTSSLIYRPQAEPVDEDAPLGPVSPYGLSKLAEDQLALHAAAHEGLQVTVARPFNHFGPGQSPTFALPGFAQQIARIEAGLAPPEIQVGNLDTWRDFSDVRDVVAAYEALMDRGRVGVPYNVCRGEMFRIGGMLDELLSMTSAPVKLVTDPARLRPNDTARIAGRADRLHRETGWTPTIPIRQTLADLLDYWRARAR
jgi:GDP-4-dehydro-6-deoxy-D-mannose reductase